MTNQSYMSRHTDALMEPATDQEKSISNLLGELSRLADRYKNDAVMLPAVEHVGHAVLVLLNGGVDRLDQGTVDRKVHDIVTRAGGDLDG